jgi:membrane fusion protein (multidrug efflux system)
MLIGLVALLVITGCSPSDGGEVRADEVGDSDMPAGARVVNVEIQPAAPEPFTDYVRIAGEVEAFHDVTVSAEESGTIAQFAVRKGAWVGQGRLIAKIDDVVLRAQVDEARAVADMAVEQYERQQRLWNEENIGSEIAVLQLESVAEAAKARLAVLEERLERTEIRAPVAGIFDEKHVEVGELVAPGTPIARVVGVRRVKVVGGIPERYALDVGRGDSARITFDVLPNRQFVGTIEFVGTSVNRSNRTIPIEIVLDNRERLVKPQMLANVQVERARLDGVVVVPQDLVLRTEDGYEVFIAATSEGRLHATARSVVLGPSYANRVVVAEGLSIGDSVIVVGHLQVDEGGLIRIVGMPGGSQ